MSKPLTLADAARTFRKSPTPWMIDPCPLLGVAPSVLRRPDLRRGPPTCREARSRTPVAARSLARLRPPSGRSLGRDRSPPKNSPIRLDCSGGWRTETTPYSDTGDSRARRTAHARSQAAGSACCAPTRSIVVNVARGAVVDDAALARALRSRHVGGAALDVFDVEPLPISSPLRGFDSTLLSPHVAGGSAGARASIDLCRSCGSWRANLAVCTYTREPTGSTVRTGDRNLPRRNTAPGGTCGPKYFGNTALDRSTSTRPATDSGLAWVEIAETIPPIELPNRTAGSPTTVSRKRFRSAALASTPVCRPRAEVSPNPARSSAYTRVRAASVGATRTQFRCEPPRP